MTNPSGNPMEAVRALMQERQRIEGWLASIESKRSTTPPHVYERVRADYEARLRSVTEQLGGRTTEIQATIAALTERLTRLHGEESALRDERFEAELRHAAGEYTERQWDDLVRQSDARLERVTGERAGIGTELQKLQQILSMAGGRAGAAAASTNGGNPAGVLPFRPPTPRPSPVVPGPSSIAPAQPARSGAGEFDELEFLKSVVDARGATGPAPLIAPIPGAPPDVVPAPEPPSPAGPAPMERAQATATSTPPAAAPPVRDEPEAAATPAAAAPSPAASAPRAEEEDAATPVDQTGSVPVFLRDVPQEQVKTLKCAECGAMNFPTEWYCERCGSELATL